MSATAPPVRSEHQLLLDFTRQREADCPVCTKPLRGLAAAWCPHCLAPLELRLDATGHRLTAWIVAILAPALPAGFALVGMIISAALMGPLAGGRAAILMRTLGAAFVVHGLTIAALVRWRRRFWRQTPRRQRALAAASASFAVIAIFAVIWQITP